MIKRLLSNWPLKLLSVFLAVLIWFIIISLADPSDVRTISNIPVSLLHEDLLSQAGKSYSVEGGSPTVNVRVSGAGSLLRELKVSDFTATADIKEMIDVNGAVPIKVTCSHPSVSDSQITLLTSAVTINYENISSKDFEISVNVVDEPPEGYFVDNKGTYVNPRKVRITAPASVLDRIGKVVAPVYVGELTESTQVESVLQYYTNTEEQLSLSEYKDTRTGTDSVMIHLEIQTMKNNVPVVLSDDALEEIKNQVPEGFRYTRHSELPLVTVKGLKSRLVDVTTISIPARVLDMRDTREDKTFQLDITRYLPEGIELMDGQEALINLTLFVEELVVREYTLRIPKLTGEADGFRYEYDPEVTVRISALEGDFVGFEPSSISLTLDVGNYARSPGKHVLQVQVSCEQSEIFTPLEGPRVEVSIKSETPPTRDRTTTAPTTTVPETTTAPANVEEEESNPATETLPTRP